MVRIPKGAVPGIEERRLSIDRSESRGERMFNRRRNVHIMRANQTN